MHYCVAGRRRVPGDRVKVSSLEQVVRALNSASVPFIVVGGLAVNAHGYGRATADVDIVVRLTPEYIRATFAALAALGYGPRVPVSAEAFADPAQRDQWVKDKGMQVLNFHSDQHRETPVDIFAQEPFNFDDEYARALVERVADDVPVRIVSLEGLIRMKESAGRPQDRADIAELRDINRTGETSA